MNIIKKVITAFETREMKKLLKKHNILDYVNLPPIQQEILEDHLVSNNPYVKIWIVNICIRLISEKIAEIHAHTNLKNNNNEIVEENNIKNILLHKPNPLQTPSEIIEQMVSNFLIYGNSYTRVIDINEKPQEIWELFANNVTPVINGIRVGGTGNGLVGIEDIASYENLEYEDISNARQRLYRKEEIIQTKSYNPDSRILGISRLQAGYDQILTTMHQARYKQRLYENGTFMGIHFTTEQLLPEDERLRIEKYLREKLKGPEKAGSMLFTWGGVKAQSIAFSPKDMDIILSESTTAAQIAAIIGCPYEMFEVMSKHSTYNNKSEAIKLWYEVTLIPLYQSFIESWNMYFFPDGDFRFEINTSFIDVLKEPSEELAKAWWLTPNERRARQGLAKINETAMDKIYAPVGLEPIEELGMDLEGMNKEL